MQDELPTFNPAEDFPRNLRGYFAASLGSFSFGAGLGFLLSAMVSYATSAVPFRAALPCGFLAVVVAGIFGPPTAYLRHSALSKAFFLVGLCVSVYAWSIGARPK